MEITLDTNICSYVMGAYSERVLQKFARLPSAGTWLSSIVVAELRYGGIHRGDRSLRDQIEAWVAHFEVRPWDEEAASVYAEIRSQLKRSGTLIGNMDLLLASHAIAQNSVLVTNNAREFLRVPQLAVDEWALSSGD